MQDTFLKAFEEGKEIKVVFCDISKAFDRFWHRELLFKLKSIGLSDEFIERFSDYLSNIRQRVCIKGRFS